MKTVGPFQGPIFSLSSYRGLRAKPRPRLLTSVPSGPENLAKKQEVVGLLRRERRG